MLTKNPTINGTALTWNNSADGKFQYALNTATDQLVVQGSGRALVSVPISGGGLSRDVANDYLTWLSINLDNTAENFVLAYLPTTSNQTVSAMMNMEEY